MLFGGGSSGGQQVEQAQAAPVEQQSYQQARMGGACEVQAKGAFLSTFSPSEWIRTILTGLICRLRLVPQRHLERHGFVSVLP